MNDETSQLIQAVTDEFYGLHCDIGRLEQENARLKHENARFRDLMYDRAHDWAIQHMTEDELRIIATNMMDENAKLMELVKMLANCAAGHGCDYCPINGGYGYVGENDMCESVHDCMHKLKVEVKCEQK